MIVGVFEYHSYMTSTLSPAPPGPPPDDESEWYWARLEEWDRASRQLAESWSHEGQEFVRRPAHLPLVSGRNGSDLAAGLAEAQECLAELSPGQLAEGLRATVRLGRWVEAMQLRMIREVLDRAEPDLGHGPAPVRGAPGVVEAGFETTTRLSEFLGDELAVTLNTTRHRAEQLVSAALLTRDVPRAEAMLADGEVDAARLAVYARELSPVADDHALVETLLHDHHDQTPRQLARSLPTRVIERHPQQATERHLAERERRSVRLRPEADGMATLSAYLPAGEARLAMDALSAAARVRQRTLRSGLPEGEPRAGWVDPGLDAHRADLLLQWCQQVGDQFRGARLADGRRPVRPADEPARVMAHVFLRGSTLAGQDDLPAELAGHGPICADQARHLVEGAVITRILTDPVTGDVSAIDTPSYRVPRVLRAATVARDRTCRWPGCTVSAAACDWDHVDPHPEGRSAGGATGRTRFDNGEMLCERHHRVKTHLDWTPELVDLAGTVDWTGPDGYRYRRAPEASGDPPDPAPPF